MKYAVTAAYDFVHDGIPYARDEIISCHATYAGACRASHRFADDLTAIAEVSDRARRGDYARNHQV